MKITYKKKKLKLNLIFGIFWFVYAIVLMVDSEPRKWYHYLWLVFSVSYLIYYLYQRKEQYLTIENGFIKQNWPFGKKMRLNEIQEIRYFAGEYILKQDKNELRIAIDLIDPKSLIELKNTLKETKATWT